jgi:hypothetical protein
VVKRALETIKGGQMAQLADSQRETPPPSDEAPAPLQDRIDRELLLTHTRHHAAMELCGRLQTYDSTESRSRT